jgi:hypothetical protein
MDDTTPVTTGEDKVIFCIPSDYNALKLIDADAYVTTNSTSGLPSIGIRNGATQEMLTTNITIDANEATSYTAATQPVIDTASSHDLVSTGDLLHIDIDVAGTGAKGLGIILRFG